MEYEPKTMALLLQAILNPEQLKELKEIVDNQTDEFVDALTEVIEG